MNLISCDTQADGRARCLEIRCAGCLTVQQIWRIYADLDGPAYNALYCTICKEVQFVKKC